MTTRIFRKLGKSGFTPFRDSASIKVVSSSKTLKANDKVKIFPVNYRNVKKHFLSLTGFTLTELLVVTSLLGTISPAAYIGAKNKAYEIQCANNLKQIGIAIQMFEIDRGRLPNAKFFPENPNTDPQSIKVILKSYGLPDEIFICPTSPQKLKDIGITYLWNDEVNGKALYHIQNRSQTWLMTDITAAYEEVSSHFGGYNVLYADFHVERVSSPPFKPETVEKEND